MKVKFFVILQFFIIKYIMDFNATYYKRYFRMNII